MKIIFLSLFLTLSYCGNAWSKIKIVTTTQDIASIAESIGADKVSISSLTKGTRDPHFATAKPSMIRKVSRADLLIAIGADLEIGWLPALTRSARNASVLPGEPGYLDLSTTINLKGKPKGPVTRNQGDVHAVGNPHYWLDPNNGIVMAESISNRLIELDSENRQFYLSNLSMFKKMMLEKINDWKSQLLFIKNKPIIAYHSSFLYLSEAFDFKIIDFIEPIPGISPGVSHLKHLIQKINQEKVEFILMEPYYETRSTDMLNRKTGINAIVIPQSVGAMPEVQTYEQLFGYIVHTIVTGK